jgi:hypothetical protein
MVVVFGVARHKQPIGMDLAPCTSCGARTYHSYERSYGVVHVFFVPLFAIGESVTADCSQCRQVAFTQAPPNGPRIPFLHRAGFVTVLVTVLAIVCAGVLRSMQRYRNEAEAVRQAKLASVREEQHLEARLRHHEEQAKLGSVTGADSAAHEIALSLVPMLQKQWSVDEAQLGVHAALIHAWSGERLLVLSAVDPSVTLSPTGLTASGHRVADTIALRLPQGTEVVWCVLQNGKYVAALSGPLGGAWRRQLDPELARLIALDALDYDGVQRTLPRPRLP